MKTRIEKHKLSTSELKACEEYANGLEISEEEQGDIERRTLGQSSNESWFKYRRGRITASRFGLVAKKREGTPCTYLLKSIMMRQSGCQTYFMKMGLALEDKVVEKYASFVQSDNVVLKDAGLRIGKNSPYLGASVDRLICDKRTGQNLGCLELKNVFDGETASLADLAIKRGNSFCLQYSRGGGLHLRKSHHYYAQIQGQMALWNLPFCDFVVYFDKVDDIHVERVTFSEKYWKNLFPKLRSFYIRHVVPEIRHGEAVDEV